jgi:hypothetical protein
LNFKKLTAVFLLFIIIFPLVFVPSARAETVQITNYSLNQTNKQSNQNNQGGYNDISSYIQNERGSVFEKGVATVLGSIAGGLLEFVHNIVGVKSLGDMVYGNNLPNDEDPFTDEQFHVMDLWYKNIIWIASVILFISVILLGFKMIFAGYDPKLRDEVKESVMRLVFVGVIIAVTPIAFRMLLYINNAFVYYIRTLIVGNNTQNIDKVFDVVTIFQHIKTGSAILTAIAILYTAYIDATITILFVIRKFVLIIFYIFTPLAAVLWSINKNVMAVRVWLGEILTNVFTQFFYAFVLSIYLSITGNKVSTGGESLIWLFAIVSVAEALRNSLQGYFTRLAGVNEMGVAGKVAMFFGAGSAVSAVSSLAGQFGTAKTAMNNMGNISGNAGGFSQTLNTGNTAPSGSMGQTAGGISSGTSLALNKGISTETGGTEGLTANNANDANAAEMGSSQVSDNPNSNLYVGDFPNKPTGTILNKEPEKTTIPPHEVMARNADSISKASHYLSKAGGITGRAVSGHYGNTAGFLEKMGRTTGYVIGSTAATYRVWKYGRETGKGFWGGLKDVTGVPVRENPKKRERVWDAARTIGRFAHMNYSAAFSDPARVRQLYESYHRTSIDGVRYKV